MSCPAAPISAYLLREFHVSLVTRHLGGGGAGGGGPESKSLMRSTNIPKEPGERWATGSLPALCQQTTFTNCGIGIVTAYQVTVHASLLLVLLVSASFWGILEPLEANLGWR